LVRLANKLSELLDPLKNEEQRNQIISILSPVALLLLWELMVRSGWLDARFFPPPTVIAARFWELATNGILAEHIGISLARVFAGFLAGTIPALLIGLTMGLFPLVRAILEPMVAATYPIPKLALLPLMLLVFGSGELSKVVTIGLGCFFLVLMNTVAGVVNIEPIYLDVARNYGASKRDFYTTIALPGALPMIFTGMKLGMGVSLLLIVAAEMIGAQNGIGYMIWTSYQIFVLEDMYIGLVLMAFFGYFFTMSLSYLEKVVVPWKQQ